MPLSKEEVAERMRHEAALGHPICGAINPKHKMGEVPITCTLPPNHNGRLHHQEGLMACFAWSRSLRD